MAGHFLFNSILLTRVDLVALCSFRCCLFLSFRTLCDGPEGIDRNWRTQTTFSTAAHFGAAQEGVAEEVPHRSARDRQLQSRKGPSSRDRSQVSVLALQIRWHSSNSQKTSCCRRHKVCCVRWVALANHSRGLLVEGDWCCSDSRPKAPAVHVRLILCTTGCQPDHQQFHTIVSLHWTTVKRQHRSQWETQRVWSVSAVQWVPIWWR